MPKFRRSTSPWISWADHALSTSEFWWTSTATVTPDAGRPVAGRLQRLRQRLVLGEHGVARGILGHRPSVLRPRRLPAGCPGRRAGALSAVLTTSAPTHPANWMALACRRRLRGPCRASVRVPPARTQPIGSPAARSRRPKALTSRSDPPVFSRTSTPTSMASKPMAFALPRNAGV